MKRKFEIIFLCLFVLTMGCQKEKLYPDTEENIEELTNLQLVKSNNPFVNEIVGSRTKSKPINDKVEYEYPWLLNIEEDNKDRVIFCIESDEDFIDRKMVYVKDGDHKFSYIIERAYVYSEAPSVEDIKVDSISTFTGILTIFTPDKIPLYSYFYSKNELVGETDFRKEINSLKSLKTAPVDGGMKNEVIVYGSKPNRTESSGSNVWFIRNGGRTTGISSSGSSSNAQQQDKKGGSIVINKTSETFPRQIKAKVELAYLKKRGDRNLTAILEALLNDSSILEENKGAIYIAIHNAYNALKGEYMMSISSAYAEALKPLIEIALFNSGVNIGAKILNYFVELKVLSSGIVNIVPEGKLANHIFKGANKLTDTYKNRALITIISNGKKLGIDRYGKTWYAKTLSNGKQIYTYTQNGIVKGAGINEKAVDIIQRYGLK